MADPVRKESWLEYRHPQYDATSDEWKYAWDHYTGEVVKPKGLTTYLVRKGQRESIEAYLERQRIADYTPHFSAVVDSLAGMLFQAEVNANRTFRDPNDPNRGLGDPDDPTSVIGKLYMDADGTGTGYMSVWKDAAVRLTALHRVWVFIDASDGTPRVRLINPQAVTNWYDQNGVTTEVLVEEVAETRGSIKDKPTADACQYLHITLNGWERFRLDEKGNEVSVGAPGSHAYVDRDGNPSLPIFQVSLPMRRNIGYTLAKKANAIFNQESARDFLLWVANFPLLNVHMSDAAFAKFLEKFKEGVNVIQNDPAGKPAQHTAPPVESARIATDVLVDKITAFWRSAFKEYGASVKEKTATEVKSDVNAGAGAFLQHLKAALDDAENRTLFLIEQTQSTRKERWGVARVERSDDFAPLDTQTLLINMATRYFGKDAAVPVGRTGRVNAARTIAQYDGLVTNDEELETSVDAAALQALSPILATLPLPPKARVELAIKALATLGLVPDGDEKVEMGDGTEILSLDALRADMLRIAEQQDAARALAAQGAIPDTPLPGQTPPGAAE